MLRDLFSIFPAYAGVILSGKRSVSAPETFPRIRGGDPMAKCARWCGSVLFPAYAGVIPACIRLATATTAFPRIRGAYQKTPRKVLRERLKKRP